MCGILGVIRLDAEPIDLVQMVGSLNLIRHRGPDDEGWLLIDTSSGRHKSCAGGDTLPVLNLPPIAQADPGAFDMCLGFRRLSILDVGESGHQPMGTSDGTVWVLFNGEIYNYLELRTELKAKGHRFHTKTDTEVLLAAYREWGPHAIERFTGMFAFCLVDLKLKKILFARDHFGIKPLYVARIPGAILFGSEVRSLLAFPQVDRHIHPQALFDYLRFGLVDGRENTLLQGVKEFPAGSRAVLDFGSGNLNFEKYWELDHISTHDIGADEAARLVRNQVAESVRLHLRSDVPLGTCLSGGLDSTAILMLMKKSLGEDHPIDAFSYISDDPILSEERYVEAACNAAKVNLHSVTPTPEEFASDLNNLINCQEFPFGGPSVYAQYRVFRMAKENGIKVMLDGQGSDELMAGYYFFIGAKITSLLCSLSVLKALSVIRGVPKNMANHFFRMLMFSFGRVLPNAMRSFFRSLVAEPLFPHWLQQSWFLANGVCGDERKSGQGRNALKQEMAIAVQQGGLAELLRYEDRNSMWFSIESRVPFCNHHLAGLTFSLPADRLISTKGVTKAVLKDSMRGIVPDMIIDRDKIGFATPERNWLSAMRPLIVEIMTDAETIKLPFFTAAREEVLLAIEGSGRWPTHVWRIINYILWSKQVGVEY